MALWGVVDRLDDLRLGVSELATNAVVHGVPPGREFCVRLVAEESAVRVEVRDSGTGLPAVRVPDDKSCTGRGLWLARAAADKFGVIEHVVGKTVWLAFEVAGTGRMVEPRGRREGAEGVRPAPRKPLRLQPPVGFGSHHPVQRTA